METLLKMYDVGELPNGTLTHNFRTIDHYQREDPGIKAKLISTKYEKDIFA